MSEFREELSAMLADWVKDDRYDEACLDVGGDECSHIYNKVVDQRRWVTLNLDVYRRADGEVAGVYYETPNTEYQEGSEGEPSVVRVREVMKPTYKVVS